MPHHKLFHFCLLLYFELFIIFGSSLTATDDDDDNDDDFGTGCFYFIHNCYDFSLSYIIFLSWTSGKWLAWLDKKTAINDGNNVIFWNE